MDMGQRLRRLDGGYLVVLAVCLLAIWPFLTIPSLPEGTDAELHVFRLHELSGLVRGGELYPRWAPNFYHGYGYPIFNYYAPLTYYLALVPELMPQIDPVGATKLVFIAGLLLAGIGMYGFVRDNWGRWAGYLAASLFVYAPYVHYVDPHMRGVSPESFSFAVFALALWALDRLRRRPGSGPWLASVLLVAGIILTHNLMGLLFFGMLAAWTVWQAGLAGWRARRAGKPIERSRRLLLPVLAMALGLGLAAFFWLPVFLERDAVNLTTLLGNGDNYDFRTHFLSLAEMLRPSLRPDWGATQSPFRFNLGVAQWLAGGLGIVLLVIGRVRRRGQVSFYALTLAVLVFLMLPWSEPIWEALPFMPYFQFPWRLLGPAAAVLAILGGAGLDGLLRAARLNETRGGAWVAALAVALPMLFALPLSQPQPWPDFGEVNTLRLSEIENSGRWLGTTSTSDYVPATVVTIPPRKAEVVAPLYKGLPPDRVNREAMPDGASVRAETVRPLLTRYYVEAPKQFRLRLYQFDFPGWRVTVDGQPAETELASPEGFIVVIVPEGEHVVEVRFGSTPPRTAGWAIALGSLVAAVVVAWQLRRSRQKPLFAPLQWRREWPIPALALGITVGAALLAPAGLFHYASTGDRLDLPAVQQTANLGDQIALLGYAPATGQAAAGETLPLTLFWKALRPLDIDYQVFVHVLDESGSLVAQSDKLNPGDFPTHRWPLDRYVPDEHRLVLPAGLPAGTYRVQAGMWVQTEGWRLPIFDEAGSQIGDSVPLFSFVVE
jgi:hypothetical protein